MNKLASFDNLFIVVSLALAFVACDDNSVDVRNFIVESTLDLDDCTSEFEGSSVFVKKDMATYVCEDGLWVDSGKKVVLRSSSTSSFPKESSSSRNIESSSSSVKKALSSSEDEPVSSSSFSSSSNEELWFDVYDGMAVVPEECQGENEGMVLLGHDKEFREMETYRYYICREGEWRNANLIEVDTYGWSAGTEDGVVQMGDVYKRYYTYDESEDYWELVPIGDSAVSFNYGCTVKREGEIRAGGNSDYYLCKDHKWYMIASDGTDTRGEQCTPGRIGELVAGTVFDNRMYLCMAQGWVDFLGWSWDIPKLVRFSTYAGVEYGVMEDRRDGHSYRTVAIGSGDSKQVWMAENLNYADSVSFPNMQGNSGYSEYDSKGDLAGRFYSWTAAMDTSAEDCGKPHKCVIDDTKRRGICPEGWHLPSSLEWKTLFVNVGGVNVAGKALKSSSGWNSYERENDEFGFSALPVYDGSSALFWTASQEDGSALASSVDAKRDEVVLDASGESAMYSIRCVKD